MRHYFIYTLLAVLIVGSLSYLGYQKFTYSSFNDYGFKLAKLSNIQCNENIGPSSGKQWYAICISNTRSKDHTVIAWKLTSF